MTSEPTNQPSSSGPNATQPGFPPPARPYKASRRLLGAGIIVAVLAVGAAGGVGASRYIHTSRPHSVLLLQPAPIAQMKDDSPVAIKGQVTEVFGSKFIVQDDTGRMLVDTGPRRDSGKALAKGEAITVQGEFKHGFVHANVMTRADGTSEVFGSPKHARPERGPGDRPGPRADRGPGPDRAPGSQPPAPRG